LFDYLGRVRALALAGLDGAGPGAGLVASGSGDGAGRRGRLLERGYVYEMVVQHEEQHQETILQALQACADPPYTPALSRPTPPAVDARMDRGPERSEGMVRIAAGPFVMGDAHPGFAYDNERPAHERELPDYWLDALPVTNADYLEFIDAGGYRERRWWSEAGWAWRAEAGAEAPLYWRRDGGRWLRRRFGREEEPPPREPVMHVSYWEAEAFARWTGKRLPTEPEWEKAALWDPAAGRSRRHPWGDEPPTPERANLDQLAFGPAAAGAYPAGTSAYGVEQMVGDAWEWTATDFTPYPGFEAFPYREYSEIFFGPDYKVLRGGSWATRPAVARGTFRNWDYPIRRQIFTGIRCARDG
jgi:iron(II)-dependent oxidoreductase